MKAKSELELQRIKAEQAQREQETAQAYKRAVEGAILSETSANFGTLDRERIEQSLSKGIGGGTRSGQDVAFGSITTDATRQEQRIIISTSDDDFVRAEVGSIQTAGDAGAAASDSINQRGDISNIDTSTIRVRQVRRTMENLHNETDLIYAFWGRNGVLPTAGEYSTINGQTGLADFWGNSFTYNRADDHEATLTATTPWGQTLVVPINLTDAASEGGITPGAFAIVMDPTLGTDGSSSTEVIVAAFWSLDPYNYNLSWTQGGANGSATGLTGGYTISLPTSDPVTIEITGQFPKWHKSFVWNMAGITDVLQWGDIAWKQMDQMFLAETGITSFSATDAPDLTNVTRITEMFRNASNFNGDISSWDMSNINQIGGMFMGASNFNQPLNSWDTSNVASMSSMFAFASSFNQPLNSWDTSNVGSMGQMFRNATSFDQDISGWCVTSIGSEPSLFDDNTPVSWINAEKPNWGTCP